MKKNVLKKVLATALASSMILGLAACGGSEEKPAETKAETTAEATEEASGDKAFQIVLSTNDGSTQDDRTAFPWLNRNMASNLMYRSILIADSSLTKTEPDLGEVAISEDGLTYTITLKDGLKWSDGEEIDG